MHHFDYKDGALHAEGVAVAKLAAEVGTPFYCYSSATLERHYQVFSGAFTDAGLDALICFSVKSNSNIAVLKTLGDLGAGADVVSQGELMRARRAGIPGDRIVFSGVGKTRAEMRYALGESIHQFNVESEAELEVLNAVAQEMGVRAPVTFRINPDVDARTHEKISTGKAENKFGIPWSRARQVYARAAELPGIEIVGLDMHIGSQLTDLAPFREAFDRAVGLVETLRADGHNIARLDLGGGLGIPYAKGEAAPPLPADYGRMIAEVAGKLDCQIILEPGRLIAGNAGIMVAQVIYEKRGENRRFVIIDAAMNDLMRPALYDAYHEIAPVKESAGPLELADIVGPICESTDIFAKGRPLPAFKEGDLIAFFSAGAYGAVMASTYNTRLLVPEILVKGDEYAVIRDRPHYEDLLGMDRVPAWLEK